MSALAEALVAAQRRAMQALRRARWDQRTLRAEYELGHIGGAP